MKDSRDSGRLTS
ncbi:hypothetical protein L345_05102, partial [Ophiophagus hannah]